MPLGRTALSLSAACIVAIAVPAQAAGRQFQLTVPAGSLSGALQALARQTGGELLFSQESVRGLSTAGLRGRFSLEEGLQRLLSGTGLAARRTASGGFVIERRRLPAPAPDAATPASDQDPPIAEILITGRRTQNADIRRRENDIQPYRVTTRRQILQAHRDNLDQYFRSRITANAQVLPPSLLDEGETISEIDLRGLGSGATLVLVDGRRLPGIPASAFGFRQPDLNAIPLHAIERVESLTGTAGGIFGFGALGGVVNVVLARDYRGLDLHGTAGISARGDSGRLSLEGRFGFTPDGGRTDVMIYLSHSTSEPLATGQRDYAERDLADRFESAPERALIVRPRGNSVGVVAPISPELSFKPQFGGGSLGAAYTTLPIGFAGSPAEMARLLAERAGPPDLSLSEGQALSDLGSVGAATAAILNVRHRFGWGVEGYVDALFLDNRGRHLKRGDTGTMFVFADSPINPFNELVILEFPIADALDRKRSRFSTTRYTAGLVAGLPARWRGTAEATLGSTRTTALENSRAFLATFLGPPLGPDLNPLGNWDEFQRGLRQVLADGEIVSEQRARARSRYGEQSLRLAGPLFETAGGTVTLSLLAERRREKVPAYVSARRVDTPFGLIEARDPVAARSNATSSIYGELRAPLFGATAPVPLLNQLEVQLAARHDRLRIVFARDPFDPKPDEIARHVFHGTAFTAGAKTTPWPWLMLRASYATGAQPPPLDLLIGREAESDFSIGEDPKRGDSFLGTDSIFLHRTQGSPDLKTALASTWSVGAVLNPVGDNRPRVSIDYSRIRKLRDVAILFDQLVLDHEDFWPERIARGPMTDSDRARGYTAGPVTMLDARAMNAGSTTIDSVDAQLDWPLRFLGGRLRLYGAATVQMRNRKRQLFQDDLERAGFRDGPLKLRANGGADWSIRGTTVGVNLQYFSHYRISPAAYSPIGLDVDLQGSRWVRARTYIDLHAGRHFRLRNAGVLRGADIEVGLVNLFDQAPARETGFPIDGPGYSRYGDPRRRRIEVALSSEF